MAVNYENLPGTGSAPLGGSAQVGTDVANLREIPANPGPLDATLPPTPIRELLAASGATLYVLAIDPGLVATIRKAAEQHPLYVVETWAELMQAVEQERCGIALLDAAVLGTRVAERVATLAAYSDRLVTLVAAERSAAHQYVGWLSDGKIHRLLIKPTAVGAARLLIESATARRLQLRDEAAAAAAPVAAPAPASTRTNTVWIASAVLAAVALIGMALVGGWLGWWNGPETADATATPAAAPPPVEAAPTLEQRVADLRAKAELAVQEGRLADPVGDNALDHYRTILAFAPEDQGARNGVSSVVETLFTRAEEALLAEDLEAAAMALDHARRAAPTSSRLAFLDAQLARGLAALAAAPAASAVTAPAPTAQAPAAAAPTELESTLNLATARLRRGQLLTPVGDSASEYYARAMELAPNDARVAGLRRDLGEALIAAARLLSGADVAAATNLAAEARRLGVTSADMAALEAELAAARTRGEQQRLVARLETARARVQAGALFAPAGDSALDHLKTLQAEVPDIAGLAETWDTFRAAAVAAIQGAIDRRDWAAAEAQLAGLSQAPGGVADVQPLTVELAAGRLQESYLATPAPASVLRLLRSTPIVYPPDALARGLEGWVDLDVVVDRTGSPRDVVVIGSSSQGRFDQSAIDAVAQYRYAPFEQDGRVYERRIRMRLRFQVETR